MSQQNRFESLDALIAKAETILKAHKNFFMDAELGAEFRSSGLSLIRHFLSTEHPSYGDFERHTNGVSTDDFRKALGILRSVRDEAQRRDVHVAVKDAVPTSIGSRSRVFVIHGRNTSARRAMFAFLRAAGLEPLEWTEAVANASRPAGSATPQVSEILEAAFLDAQAFVVLLTGDDMARLGTRLEKATDPSFEKELTPQPRPNVLFEAGMALGRFPQRTIMVSFDDIRPFSDVAGRHTIRITNSKESRQNFLSRLKTAGCDISKTQDRTDWMSEGDFEATIGHPDI